MKCCTEKAKQEILIRYMCGDTPKELSEKFGIHVATVYRWINTWENETGKHFLTELPLQEMGIVLEYVKGLKQQLEETERALAIIHESKILQAIPLRERLNVAMSFTEIYSAKLLCHTFEISQSTFYHHRRNKGGGTERQQRDCDICNAIRNAFAESGGRLGSRRIQVLLHRRGIEVGKRKVSKLMKQMGLSTNQGTTIYYSPTCMSHMEEVDDVKIL